jgi:hypothetical protein
MFPPSGMTPKDYGAVIGIAATSLSDEELLNQLAMHQAAVSALLKVGRERHPVQSAGGLKWTYEINLSEYELEAMAQVSKQFSVSEDLLRPGKHPRIDFGPYVSPVVK